MSGRLQEVRYGRLVWARLKDRNGFRKERPGIILTPTHEIRANQPIVVMGMTTSYSAPPPPDHIELPWNPDPRKVGMRLARRSAAVIGWLDSLYPDEVMRPMGMVPVSVMSEIQRRVGQLRGEGLEDKA